MDSISKVEKAFENIGDKHKEIVGIDKELYRNLTREIRVIRPANPDDQHLSEEEYQRRFAILQKNSDRRVKQLFESRAKVGLQIAADFNKLAVLMYEVLSDIRESTRY